MLAAVIGLLVSNVICQVRLTVHVEGCYPELVSQELKITVAYTMLTHSFPGVAEPTPSAARDMSDGYARFVAVDSAETVKEAQAFEAETGNDLTSMKLAFQLATTRPLLFARAARSSGAAHEDRRGPLVHARPCLQRRHARQNGKGQWRMLAAVIGLLVSNVICQVRLTVHVEGCYPELT